MRKNRKKKHVQNKKRKNLGTANFTDFDGAGQQRIREQCLAAVGGQEVTDYTSATSSLTGSGSYAPSASRGCGRGGGGNRSFCPCCYYPSQASDANLHSKQLSPYPNQVW